MSEQFKVPFSHGSAEYEEKRSRFIGQIWNVQSEAEAVRRINEVRAEHREARHNVYAYLCREANATGYSDDGEPKGTGGMPVLMLLRGMGLTDVCCVVTRYFGGILLGTGGLARAYTEAARRAAEAAGCCVLEEFSIFGISFGYDRLERIKKIAEQSGGYIEDVSYQSDITAKICVPRGRADSLAALITEATAGAVKPELIGTQMKKQALCRDGQGE